MSALLPSLLSLPTPIQNPTPQSRYALALPAPLIDPASVETPPPVKARIKEMQKQMDQMYSSKRALENQLSAAQSSLQSSQSAQGTMTLALHKLQKEKRIQEDRWAIEREEVRSLNEATQTLLQDRLSLSSARQAVTTQKWAREKEVLEGLVAKSAHDNVKLQSKVDDLRLGLQGREDAYEASQTAYNQVRKSLSTLRTTHTRLTTTHTTLASLSSTHNTTLAQVQTKSDQSAAEINKLKAELKVEKEGKERAEKEGRMWMEEKEEKERELKGWVREEKGKGNDAEKHLRTLESEIRFLKSDLEVKSEEASENAEEVAKLRKEVRGAARLKEELESVKADKQETDDICEKLASKLRKMKAANALAETVPSPVKKSAPASASAPDTKASATVPAKAKERKSVEPVEEAQLADDNHEEQYEAPLRPAAAEVASSPVKASPRKRKADVVSESEGAKKLTSKKAKATSEESSRPRPRPRVAMPSPSRVAAAGDCESESDGYVPPKKSAPVKISRPVLESTSKATKSSKPLSSTNAQKGESKSKERRLNHTPSTSKLAGDTEDGGREKDKDGEGSATTGEKPKKTMRKLGNPLNSLGGGASFLSLMLDNPNGTIPGVMSPVAAPGRLGVKPTVKRFGMASGGTSRF